jgi:CheY-like chemotaxis protein
VRELQEQTRESSEPTPALCEAFVVLQSALEALQAGEEELFQENENLRAATEGAEAERERYEPRLIRARETIERQVAHRARLLDDLMNVSRNAVGKVALNARPLELQSLVRDTTADYHIEVEAAGLTLTLELPEDAVWIEGDATRLAQAIGNLLHNALKFTDRGGEVRVRLDTDPATSRATITVSDTGIGIEPAMLPHVFETCTQADRSRGGLGPGLALVKGLTELHGGEVRATSEGVGRGATFSIALPLSHRPAAPEQSSAPDSVAQVPIRVLVVEDNRDTADGLRDLMELIGCTVDVAYSGPEGLRIAARSRPDLILCDLGLPGMDGYEVAKELRRDPATSDARLIAVSGYGQEEDKRRCRQAGFDLHLTKPVEFADLQRLIDEASRKGGS